MQKGPMGEHFWERRCKFYRVKISKQDEINESCIVEQNSEYKSFLPDRISKLSKELPKEATIQRIGTLQEKVFHSLQGEKQASSSFSHEKDVKRVHSTNEGLVKAPRLVKIKTTVLQNKYKVQRKMS